MTAETVSPLFEFHFLCATTCNYAFNQILPNTYDNVGHDTAERYLFELTLQLISG